MIEYKYPKEKEISLFYANKLQDISAISILENSFVRDSTEAIVLAKFYWAMVAEAINEKNNGIDNGFGDMQQWLEYICNTFFFYLSNNGYEDEWDSQ